MEEQKKQQKIAEYMNRWVNHPLSHRVTQTETIAIEATRVYPWDGITIPDFWAQIIEEHTEWVERQIKKNRQAKAMEVVLEEEQKLLDEADRLSEQLDSYLFGPFDPRYLITARKLSQVVKKFRLVDQNYHLNFPKTD